MFFQMFRIKNACSNSPASMAIGLTCCSKLMELKACEIWNRIPEGVGDKGIPGYPLTIHPLTRGRSF